MRIPPPAIPLAFADAPIGETYNLYVWSGAELFVIILCGSVPPTKPVYDRYFGKPLAASLKGSSGYQRYGSSGSGAAKGGSSAHRPSHADDLDRLHRVGKPIITAERDYLPSDDTHDLEAYPRGGAGVPNAPRVTTHITTTSSPAEPPRTGPPGRMLPAGDISVPWR